MRYTLRPVRSLLWVILALTFAVRVGLAWRVPSIHQADEIYQVAEQANRAVNGFGIQSWEFQTAARGAFFAVLVEPIYRLHLSPAASQVLVAALFSLLSLIPIWVAFAWTRRIHGDAAGLLAALLTATWFELMYFGPKPTADAVGGYLLIAGLYFARMGLTKREAALAGFTLLVALGARMQIATVDRGRAPCRRRHARPRAVRRAGGGRRGRRRVSRRNGVDVVGRSVPRPLGLPAERVRPQRLQLLPQRADDLLRQGLHAHVWGRASGDRLPGVDGRAARRNGAPGRRRGRRSVPLLRSQGVSLPPVGDSAAGLSRCPWASSN